MGGGIAILLALIIVVVAIVIGAVMYLTGGAFWLAKTSKKGDLVEGSDDGRFERRPEHKAVTSETIENTHVVGTRDDDR